MKPKVIFFDLDETLVENVIPVQKLFAEMYFQFSDSLGIDNREAFFAALRHNATHLWATMFEKEKPPEKQFVDCFATAIGALNSLSESQIEPLANAMFERFAELSAKNVRFQDGATQTLGLLRSKGFTTGIITNGMEHIQMGKIDALDLQRQVDHVVISAQARAHKPHAKVFNFALQKADVVADQAWQIGDHLTNDVAGAIRAGMSGVFYNPFKQQLDQTFNELEEQPTHVIHQLADVIQLVQ